MRGTITDLNMFDKNIGVLVSAKFYLSLPRFSSKISFDFTSHGCVLHVFLEVCYQIYLS